MSETVRRLTVPRLERVGLQLATLPPHELAAAINRMMEGIEAWMGSATALLDPVTRPVDLNARPTWFTAIPSTGATAIARGDPVRVLGAVDEGPPIVGRADAAADATMGAVGIAAGAAETTFDAPLVVVSRGLVRNLNTNAWAVGTKLYVASGGGLTSTAPASRIQHVATVVIQDLFSGAIWVIGSGESSGVAIDHGALTGLADDDHTQYAHMTGRASGQTLRGGVAASEGLTLGSTSHATKGVVTIEDETKMRGTVHGRWQQIASAGTIDVTHLGNHVEITGTTVVSTINGGEDSTLLVVRFTGNGSGFNTSGNVADSYVSQAGEVVVLFYDPNVSGWRIVSVGGTTAGSPIPAGSILAVGFSSTPSGWLLCDGSAVSRSTYARLFAAISTTWGPGDGSTTFNVPDLRDQFLKGLNADALAAAGGSATPAVAITDPGHGHVVVDPGHAHAIVNNQGHAAGAVPTAMVQATTAVVTGITVPGPDLTGITAAIADGRPPYKTVRFLIKT